jgi:hypothetical protein
MQDPTSENSDEELDIELTDLQAGFLSGYFAARGVKSTPTTEQFSEAVDAMNAWYQEHEAEDPQDS